MNKEKLDDQLLMGSGVRAEKNPIQKSDDIRELLNLVTQETRFVLLLNIVAHPKEMPSLKELAYANPEKSSSTIRNHLDKLIAADIVETVALPEDDRSRDLPYRFYRITDFGWDFLKSHDLLVAEDTVKEMHSMLEKTEKIEKYENAPRPDNRREEIADDDESDRSSRSPAVH